MVATVEISEIQDVLAALADPTRLAILAQLRTRDLCVCHLVERLELKQSIISHHVGILRRAGLIDSHANPTDRRWLYYRLNRVRLVDVASHLDWLLDDGDYDPTPLPCGPDAERDAG
ncbi:MAG TPA: metalloregulator ArsR/SmtB family transcription factor [Thermomicrobiales bacterium]|nr:metalloregulator ArsR/SmtB family transcription factor [Thermomicrobiales bacterium]